MSSQSLDPSKYVNKETGELMDSEFTGGKTTIRAVVDKGTVTYNSRNYAYLDLDAISTLRKLKIIRKSDYATLLIITEELSYSSALLTEGKLHDVKTLSEKAE